MRRQAMEDCAAVATLLPILHPAETFRMISQIGKAVVSLHLHPVLTTWPENTLRGKKFGGFIDLEGIKWLSGHYEELPR